MENMHHKPLKRFGLSGNIYDDSEMWRLKGEYINLLVSEMRFAGYVPRLDIDIDFTIDYNEAKQHFEFEISMYAIFVGKKKSEWILGVDSTRVVPILQNRLSEFLSEVV
jgi:hypothetical protein